MCRCMLPPIVGPPMLACGPPHGRACCIVVGPPSWWGVLCWCVAHLMVGPAGLVPARRGGCAWSGGAGVGFSYVPPGDWRCWARVGGVLARALRRLFCWFGVVFAALRSACSGGCGRRSASGWGCVVWLAGVGAVLVRGPPLGGVFCVGAWPPPMVGRAVLMTAPRPLWAVLCWCLAPPKVGRAVLACSPPHGRPCCFVVWPPSWWGVLCWCVAPLMVGRAVLMPVRRGGCAWCGGAGLGLSSCVVPGGQRRWVRVGGACGDVLAGFVCSVLSSPPYGRRLRVGVVGGWVVVVVVLIAWRGLVLRWCAAHLMVGQSVLVRAPPHGGACCVGLWSPSWWGVLCWWPSAAVLGRGVVVFGLGCRRLYGCGCGCVVCLARVAAVLVCAPHPPFFGRAVFVRAPHHGGACCVGVCPPPWWGVLRWYVAPLSVGRAVSVPARRGGGVWFGGAWLGLSSSVGWVVVAVLLFAWPGLVLCWCVPPPLLGPAVFVRGPPLGGACCVGVFGVRFVVL